MGKAAAAALVAGLFGCAAVPAEEGVPAAVPGPVEAVSGPDRLTLVEARWVEDWAEKSGTFLRLKFRFDSSERGSLLSRAPARILAEVPSGRVVAGDETPVQVEGDEAAVLLAIPRPGVQGGTLASLRVDCTVLRVREWSEFVREGLMDGGLDEMEWPPWTLRFAGEGESCWLAIGPADEGGPMFGFGTPAKLGDYLSPDFAARRASLRDAKGRDLVPWSIAEGKSGLVVTSGIHLPGQPPPEDPTIDYPVALRLVVPGSWHAETVRFTFGEVPLPEPRHPFPPQPPFCGWTKPRRSK